MTSGDWCAAAAYFYVQHLSPAALAWEYLRRNAAYRSDWCQYAARAESPIARRWGLEFLWDPLLDARDAQPVWLPSPSAQLRLCKSDEPFQDRVFSLWRFPGRKNLFLSNSGMLLSLQLDPSTTLNLALNQDLHAGCSFTYGVAPHIDPSDAASAISRLLPLIKCPCSLRPSAAMRRPSAKAERHRRHLQALDADAAGATHREIAVSIFGERDVWERWTSDNSEIRAQVRYILKSARAFVDGGYRKLLTGVNASAQ